MNWKRLLGAVLALGGIVLLVFSFYIKEQIALGQHKIQSAQQKVDTTNRLFSIRPETQQVGQTVTNPIQQKINEGSKTVAEYAALAHRLQFWGIVCLAGGGILLVFGRKRTV